MGASGTFSFLVETYRTEVEKTLSVWSMFDEQDLARRPVSGDRRGRNAREHMVHQCVGENGWFANMLGIAVPGPVTPADETRAAFIACYAAAAAARLGALAVKDDAWWGETVAFFAEPRSRAWVMVRRIAHTAHHRGQQTVLLRLCGKALHSTYGPSADTGGLPKDQAPVVYPYPDLPTLLRQEGPTGARQKQALPAAPQRAVTERPDP
ncbi:MAG: damage-inducible protein DinB [Planctomycetes bacterium]|nr:damage-inducible protein DinB [Planctomycetota bacterium]